MSIGLTKGSKAASGKPASPTEVPDKLYFRIGEVARICDVAAYVLRFWESEFPQLKPNKGGTGQRLYRKRDVELALKIKRLLYEQGFTIAGARRALIDEKHQARDPQTPLPFQVPAPSAGKPKRNEARLRQMRAELEQIVMLLSQPRPDGDRSAGQSAVGANPKRSKGIFARIPAERGAALEKGTGAKELPSPGLFGEED